MRLLPSRQATHPADGMAVAVENVWAGYGNQTALQGIDFEAPAASMVALVGPNGSGKSTLIKVILGTHGVWRGRVRIFGREPGNARRLIGYTPQTESVDWEFPVTVRDVVTMGRFGRLGPLRWPGAEDKRVVQQCLERLGIADLAKRQIGELSGGQQRRVLIARALAQEPQVLLMDEPMAGLDATIQHELLALFEGLRDEGKTIVMATHDLSCVDCCFDRVLLMNRRKIAYGSPEEAFTKELLDATFESHLITLPIEGGFYVDHHGHA
ncbi:MAG: metal ABC transporter ATP-binding protein [Dehalococcoidia bacterium]